MRVGPVMRRIREERGGTVEGVAAELDSSGATISRFETKSRDRSFALFDRLCEHYGVPAWVVVYEAEHGNAPSSALLSTLAMLEAATPEQQQKISEIAEVLIKASSHNTKEPEHAPPIPRAPRTTRKTAGEPVT